MAKAQRLDPNTERIAVEMLADLVAHVLRKFPSNKRTGHIADRIAALYSDVKDYNLFPQNGRKR